MDEIKQLEYKLKKSKEELQLDNKNRKIDKIENIIIDTNKPIADRILDFFKQVNNPYSIKVGNIIVDIEFSENSGLSPVECIDNALINEYKMRELSKV